MGKGGEGCITDVRVQEWYAGNSLRRWRIRWRRDAPEVERQLRLPRGQVHAWETGVDVPDRRALRALARATGITDPAVRVGPVGLAQAVVGTVRRPRATPRRARRQLSRPAERHRTIGVRAGGAAPRPGGARSDPGRDRRLERGRQPVARALSLGSDADDGGRRDRSSALARLRTGVG